jgi:flagella basal body P-ring formation protein FlgA
MRLIAAIVLCAAMASPAFAGVPVTLRNDTSASGPITLGDLFDGAGRASNVVVAQGVTSGSVVLDAAQVQRVAINAGLTWANEQGLRRVIVHAGAAAPSAPVAGRAGNVEVLTWKRSLDAGEIIAAEDLTWSKAVAAPAGAPRDPDQLIGKAVKRPLREGASASLRDVANPVVIKKDDLVTVIYAVDGVNVSMQGKAVTTAALGEPVTVMNTTSKKLIQAVASGVAQALVGPQADALRAQTLASNPLIASR